MYNKLINYLTDLEAWNRSRIEFESNRSIKDIEILKSVSNI